MKDRFSTQARQYQKFRPHYPEKLYDFLFNNIYKFDSAWDCGTGNGQVAAKLAERFKTVYATDISENQLREATSRPNIRYLQQAAEQTGFEDSCFDLITVAQAAHWFELTKFYDEIMRVAKPDALLAIWGYNLLKIDPEINHFVDELYRDTLGTYWDTERKLVDEEYKNIPFPFKELATPELEIVVRWSRHDLVGYLTSWSAVQNFIKKNGLNPIEPFLSKITRLWDEEETKTVRFKIFSRMGRVEK